MNLSLWKIPGLVKNESEVATTPVSSVPAKEISNDSRRDDFSDVPNWWLASSKKTAA